MRRRRAEKCEREHDAFGNIHIDEISFQTLGCINFSCWQGQKPIKMKVPIINYIKSKECPIPLSSFFFFYVEVFNIISFGTDVLVYYIL